MNANGTMKFPESSVIVSTNNASHKVKSKRDQGPIHPRHFGMIEKTRPVRRIEDMRCWKWFWQRKLRGTASEARAR